MRRAGVSAFVFARRKPWVCSVLASLALFNILHLLFHSPIPTTVEEKPRRLTPPSLPSPLALSFLSSNGKPWPSVPSFRPWIADPKLPPNSCEGYFGHGFTRRIEIAKGSRPLRRRRLQAFLTEYSAYSEHMNLIKGGFEKGNTSTRIGGRKPLYTDLRASEEQSQKEGKGRLASWKDSKNAGGLFECLYSETLRTSVCQGTRMVMHPSRITMSNGGEPINSVIGRSDEEELPIFGKGAFEIEVNQRKLITDNPFISNDLLKEIMPQGQISQHTMRELLENIRTVASDDIHCSEEIAEPTLIVTRFEYANLFHTLTDWYSGYASSRVLGLMKRPNVILVDGHCQSPMDDGWTTLFSNVTYAKAFSGSVCLHNAIFTPLGYETAIFKGHGSGLPCYGCSVETVEHSFDHSKTARLREFGESFKAAFSIRTTSHSKENEFKVLFVRREDYLAHPRHTGKPESRLRNEEELLESLQAWANPGEQGIHPHPGILKKGGLKLGVINGRLAHMKMREQLEAVEEASVILGVHGAGMSHIVFARPGTIVIELLSPLFPRPHYEHISQWMGLKYHSIYMRGTVANCTEVLQLLTKVIEELPLH